MKSTSFKNQSGRSFFWPTLSSVIPHPLPSFPPLQFSSASFTNNQAGRCSSTDRWKRGINHRHKGHNRNHCHNQLRRGWTRGDRQEGTFSGIDRPSTRVRWKNFRSTSSWQGRRREGLVGFLFVVVVVVTYEYIYMFICFRPYSHKKYSHGFFVFIRVFVSQRPGVIIYTYVYVNVSPWVKVVEVSAKVSWYWK